MAGRDDRETESRRIINRVGAETEASMPKRARDEAESDWAELWGTRIGRILGLVLLAYVLYELFRLLVDG